MTLAGRIPPAMTCVARVCLCAALAAAGCARESGRAAGGDAPAPLTPATAPAGMPAAALADAEWNAELQAMIVPPVGWQPSVLPGSFNAVHQVWISPSGRTAYGVIRFSLPFPSPHDPVLWVFLKEMRRKEGQADLLEKRWDRERRGLRAVIEGGRYTIRTTITIRGLSGWMTYAGTLREAPVEPEELHHAETAREQTRVGKSAADGQRGGAGPDD